MKNSYSLLLDMQKEYRKELIQCLKNNYLKILLGDIKMTNNIEIDVKVNGKKVPLSEILDEILRNIKEEESKKINLNNFELVRCSDVIRLIYKYKGSNRDSDSVVLNLYEDGTCSRVSSVGKHTGLNLDGFGRLIIDDIGD